MKYWGLASFYNNYYNLLVKFVDKMSIFKPSLNFHILQAFIGVVSYFKNIKHKQACKSFGPYNHQVTAQKHLRAQ